MTRTHRGLLHTADWPLWLVQGICTNSHWAAHHRKTCALGYQNSHPAEDATSSISPCPQGAFRGSRMKINLHRNRWWPRIERAMERYCPACHRCQLVARPDPPESLRSTTLLEGPCTDVAADLMGPLPSRHSLLVVVSYYSQYYEMMVLQSTTWTKVIEGLEEIFSQHGLPATWRQTTGPQFVSAEFCSYMAENGIRHNCTTPHWALVVGEVERQNSSIFKHFKIAQAEGQDWRKEVWWDLLQYRVTSQHHRQKPRTPLIQLPNLHKMPKFDSGTQPSTLRFW